VSHESSTPIIPYAPKYYLVNPYTFTLDATVKTLRPIDSARLGLILNTTIFRPAGGGQEPDHGYIQIHTNQYPIQELKETSESEILHIIDTPKTPIPLNQSVSLYLDQDRRIKLMRAHTGQHILARELFQITEQKPLKVQIGPDHGRLIYPETTFSWDLLIEAEAQVNQIIHQGIPIETMFYSSLEEVQQYYGDKIRIGIRGSPNYIRVISIHDYDAAACTGTHLANTQEVLSLKILNLRTSKKTVMIDFAVGSQIMTELAPLFNQLWPIAQSLSTGMKQLPPKIQRLAEDLNTIQNTLRTLETSLIPQEAKNLLNQSTLENNVFLSVAQVPYTTIKGGFQILDTALHQLNDQQNMASNWILALIVGEQHPQVVAKLHLPNRDWQDKLQERIQDRGTIKSDFTIFPVPTNTSLQTVKDLFKTLIV
jgi:alanyl-tRNA synthetase